MSIKTLVARQMYIQGTEHVLRRLICLSNGDGNFSREAVNLFDDIHNTQDGHTLAIYRTLKPFFCSPLMPIYRINIYGCSQRRYDRKHVTSYAQQFAP